MKYLHLGIQTLQRENDSLRWQQQLNKERTTGNKRRHILYIKSKNFPADNYGASQVKPRHLVPYFMFFSPQLRLKNPFRFLQNFQAY